MKSSRINKGSQRESVTMKTLVASMGLLSTFAMLDATALQLNSVDTSALSGDSVEIRLGFDSAPPAPSGYTIENPARIALDIPGATSGLKDKYHTLGSGNARSMTVIGTSERTRVIINLGTLTGYETRVDGNNLIVKVGAGKAAAVGNASAAEATTVAAAPVADAAPAPVASSGSSVQQIDFHRGDSGEGLVTVALSDPNAAMDLREEGGRIVLELTGVALPEALQRRLDVLDFATPVKLIDATREGGKTRIAITAKGDYEYMAYQTDGSFTVAVKPIAAAELERKKRDRFQYTGEKLSLNFQDIEVRSVLQLIADFTELNLVASDTVNGRITLRLQNVPWDQALDLILKTKGLDKRKIGNVLLVAPADEIAAREKLELEAQKQVQELAPLKTEYMTINYAKAEELSKLLTKDAGFITERGSVAVDKRTNTLIIQETASKLDEIRYMLEQLDIPVRQVLIEARVVIASTDVGEEMGVRWNVAGSSRFGNDLGVISGTGAGVEQNITSLTPAVDPATGLPETPPAYTIDDINTPALDFGVKDASASSIAVGIFNDHGLLDVELSALENEGRANVVSTPKVLTADQQTARVASGTEIPYQEASASGATTTAFKEAVLALEVTPQITPDGRIIMNLKVNQDSVGKIDQASRVPVIDKNEVKTNVIVDNGQTVVLGGVFKTEDVKSVAKTPFLGDLPVLGKLFRKNIQSQKKAELLVFITPRVVTDVLNQQ